MTAIRMPCFMFVLALLWQSCAIDTEDVHKLATEVASLTSATWDIMVKLRHISKHAATFIRVTSPIGSLIAAGAEVAFPPDSPEFQAIKELQKFVASKFGALTRHVEMHANEIKYFIVENDYHADLKARLFTNCPYPSDHETRNYAAAFDFFHKIEKKHRKNFSIPDAFIKILLGNRRAKAENKCWLQAVVKGNSWRRDQLYHFAEIVRLDLMKTSIFATHCANISREGSPYDIEKELKEIEMLLKEISNHMAGWIEAKLEKSWPTIMSKFASAATGDEPIEEEAAKYKQVAFAVKKALDRMGPVNFFQNVLIFPNWNDPRQYSKNCPGHYCFDVMGVNGVNLVVVRYRDDQYQRAVRAFNWFDKQKASELATIVEEWYADSKSQPLDSLMERLKRELDGFGDPDYYPNVVLLRNWMFFRKAATVTIGYTLTSVRAVSTQKGMDSVLNPWLLDAEHYHIHFFL